MKQPHDIAVIGIACRLPDADSPKAFFNNLANGHCSIRSFSARELESNGVSAELFNRPNYKPFGAAIEGFTDFDHEYFQLTPKEARLLDPQHRLLMELAVHVLEDAGIKNRPSINIGLFGSVSASSYFLNHLLATTHQGVSDFTIDDAYRGTRSSFAISRIAYHLGFTGPAMLVDTACSSSLVAVHEAIQALRSGDCDMALAGGVSLQVPVHSGYLYHQDGIMSEDGLCRAFDAAASGSVRGNGGGLVMLKPLDKAIQDQDKIYGVIVGSSVNNDGNQRMGFTAPSSRGQSQSIVKALQDADLKAAQLVYYEAHGSGTRLGDEIELKAIAQAIRLEDTLEKPQRALRIGSVKTNVGHLDGAAGITGLIKTLLMLEQRTLVPSLHYSRPNDTLRQLGNIIEVQTDKEFLSAEASYHAAVASLGIGGTNAHIVIRSHSQDDSKQQLTKDNKKSPLASQHITFWVPVSATTTTALAGQVMAFAEILPDLNNYQLLCAIKNLWNHRAHYPHRILLSGSDVASLLLNIHQLLENVGGSSEYTDTQALHNNTANPFKGSDLSNYANLPDQLAQWLAGGDLCFQQLYPELPDIPWIRLPNYRFERHRHWVPDPLIAHTSNESPQRQTIAQASSAQGDIATSLLQVWENAFGFSPIETDKNFFELGGHSLLATQILSKINEQFNVVLGLKDFFANPTIDQLNAFLNITLNQDLQHGNLKSSVTPRTDNYTSVPLTPMQLELWYQHMLAPDEHTYNLVAAEQISGPLQLYVLYRAIEAVINKHAILRAHYKLDHNQVVQSTVDTVHQAISYRDISHSNETIEQHIDTYANQPFDLSLGRLFEARILKVCHQQHVLILRQHRIVSDAQTLGIVFREIVSNYLGLHESSRIPDSTLDTSYFDFSYQLQQHSNDKQLLSPLSQRLMQEQLFWQQQLQHAPITQIPTDRTHRAGLSEIGESLRFKLPQSLTPKIQHLCETHGLSTFSFLLSCFKLALHSFTRQTDLIVVTPALNRDQAAFAESPGHFMNRVAIRSQLDIKESFTAAFSKIHGNSIQALEHQSLPFEAMLEATGLMKRYRSEPLLQTVFMIQDTEQDESLSLPNITLNPVKVPFHRSRYDLTGVMRMEQGVFHGRIDCKAALMNDLILKQFRDTWTMIIDTAVHQFDQSMAAAINYQDIHLGYTDKTTKDNITDNEVDLLADFKQNEAHTKRVLNYWQLALGQFIPTTQFNQPRASDFWQLGGSTRQLVLLYSLIKKDFPGACFKRLASQPHFHGHVEYLASLPLAAAINRASNVNDDNHYIGPGSPLSPFQTRLWFLQHYHPETNAYNLPATFLIQGKLDPKKLFSALSNTQQQFYLLNCGIMESDNTPYWLKSNEPVNWQVNDISDLSPEDQDASLEFIADKTLKSPFSFDGNTPSLLWRSTWVRLSDEESVLLLCFHHLIADQLSGGLFLQRLLNQYLTISQAGDLDPQQQKQKQKEHENDPFCDFVVSQQTWLNSEEAQNYRRFWRVYLEPCQDLNMEFTSTSREFITHEMNLCLTRQQTAALVQLGKRCFVSLNTVLQTLYGIFLYRLTGQTCFCIGMPVSLHENQWQNCFGPLLNTLPIKCDIKPFNDLEQQIKVNNENLFQAIEHKNLPLEEIIAITSAARSADLPPLFQTTYSFLEEQPLNLMEEAAEFSLTTIATRIETSDYPIAFEAVKQSDTLELRLSLSDTHFNQATRNQLLKNLATLIDQSLAAPQQPIDGYLLPLSSISPTALICETKPGFSLTRAFLIQAELHPEKLAISGFTTINYHSLRLQAGRIQQQFKDCGISNSQGVAILINDRQLLPRLLLACLASGIYFVPIDIRWGKSRINQVLSDSRVSALVTDSDITGLDIAVSNIIDPDSSTHSQTLFDLSDNSQPSDLAYIMYTSGSTGKPKGVAISQRALSSYSQNIPDEIKPRAHHRVLALTSFSFDIMLTELLLPLITGGTVAIFNEPLMPQALADFIKQQQVNYIQTTPSLWQLLLEAPDIQFADSSIALTGGEKLPTKLAQQLLDKGLALYNVYGPTEATVWCTSKQVTQALINSSTDYINNVGKAFYNTRLSVSDGQLTILAEGAIGELLLSGENLAEGYWRNQPLSDRQFIHNTFPSDAHSAALKSEPVRQYRSGDRVQLLNGEIYFLGRYDEQIKLNGQRIELNAINHIINQMQGIKAVYSTLVNKNNGAFLASYVCSDTLQANDIKQYLRDHLPAHHVPSLIWVEPEAILSSNGKLNINRVKEHLNNGLISTNDTDTPSLAENNKATPAALKIKDVMAQVLDCGQMNLGDSFFDKGGNSLMAIRVVNKLSDSFNLQIPLRSIFESPTPSQLGNLIESVLLNDGVDSDEEMYEEGQI